MEACVHQVVCNYTSPDEANNCALDEVCKHYCKDFRDIKLKILAPLEKLAELKKDEVSTSLTAFKKAKVFLSINRKWFDENQKAAFEALSGKHFSHLSAQQVKQYIDIASDVRKKKE
jgi:RNA-splicing ligase RtcB